MTLISSTNCRAERLPNLDAQTGRSCSADIQGYGTSRCARTLRSARSPCSTGIDCRYSELLVCAKAFRSKRVCCFTVELGVYHEHALVQCRKFLSPPTTRRPKLCRVFRALRQRSRLCRSFLRWMMQRSAPFYLTLRSARIPFVHRYRCPLTPPIACA